MGKIVSGTVEVGKLLKTLDRLGAQGAPQEQTSSSPQKVLGLFVTRGVTRESLGAVAAGAGDIVTVAGVRRVLVVLDYDTLVVIWRKSLLGLSEKIGILCYWRIIVSSWSVLALGTRSFDGSVHLTSPEPIQALLPEIVRAITVSYFSSLQYHVIFG